MTSTMTPPMSDQDRRERDERLARLAVRRTPAAVTTAPTAPASGRRHAARGSRTAALAISAGTTVGLATFLHGLQSVDTTAVATTESSATAAIINSTATGATTAATGVVSTVPAAPAATASTAATLADGSYTGGTFTNRWGPVQVQITISGGEIAAVDVLQTPTDDRKSITINNRAVPTLVSETLTAQSAQIDSVSGATYTSTGYMQSLQSAIDAARAA